MNAPDLDFLLSSAGRSVVESLAHEDLSPGAELPLLDRLRRTLPASHAAAAFSAARLRRRAGEKFPGEAQRMWFLPEALEQSSARPLAELRARQIDERAPAGPVLELGAGIGGDTLRLAARREVIAYESDPLRARLLRANLEALGLDERVEVREEDWTRAHLPSAAAAYADPGRRRDGRRVFSLNAMEPPLSALGAVRGSVPNLAVKVAPGVRDEELPPDCSVDFVGRAGECREAVLWFGDLSGTGSESHAGGSHRFPDSPGGGPRVRRRACVLTASGWQFLEAAGAEPPLGPLAPGLVLYEPEPAVVRAGALAEMAVRLSGWLFDPHIAWLVGPEPRPDPLAQAFLVLEAHRFQLKTLRRRLRELGASSVEIKKRGFALEPEELRSRLRLAPGGRQDLTVLLTRRGDEPLMLLAVRVSGPASAG